MTLVKKPQEISMALPPNKITDHLMIRVSGYVENVKAEEGVALEVYVNTNSEQDDWEIVEFIARKGDNLTLNRELYTVESIVSHANNAHGEDSTTPGALKGVNVVLRSASNHISLSA